MGRIHFQPHHEENIMKLNRVRLAAASAVGALLITGAGVAAAASPAPAASNSAETSAAETAAEATTAAETAAEATEAPETAADKGPDVGNADPAGNVDNQFEGQQ